MKRWFAEHPDYPKIHLANQKKLRAELGTALNGTIPVKATKKITYVVNVRKPLKPGERMQRPIKSPKKRSRQNESDYSTQGGEFSWDTQ